MSPGLRAKLVKPVSASLEVGVVISGRDREMKEGPETWVWASLDDKVKAEALPPVPSLGNLGSRIQAVGHVTGSGQGPFWVQKQTLPFVELYP